MSSEFSLVLQFSEFSLVLHMFFVISGALCCFCPHLLSDNHVTRLLQGCHKVFDVKVVTTLSQPCHMVVVVETVISL